MENSYIDAFDAYIKDNLPKAGLSYLPIVSASGNVQLSVPLPPEPYTFVILSVKTGGSATNNTVCLKNDGSSTTATGINVSNIVMFIGVVRSPTELHFASINNAAPGGFGSNVIFNLPMSTVTICGGTTGSGTVNSPEVAVCYM